MRVNTMFKCVQQVSPLGTRPYILRVCGTDTPFLCLSDPPSFDGGWRLQWLLPPKGCNCSWKHMVRFSVPVVLSMIQHTDQQQTSNAALPPFRAILHDDRLFQIPSHSSQDSSLDSMQTHACLLPWSMPSALGSKSAPAVGWPTPSSRSWWRALFLPSTSERSCATAISSSLQEPGKSWVQC